MANLIAKVDPESGQVTLEGGGYMSMIQKLAGNPTLQSVEIIERMMAQQEKWEIRQAQKAFEEAMLKVAKKLKGLKIIKHRSVAYDIDKNDKAKGQKEAFRYAALEDIDKIVRPVLDEENIRVSYDTEPCTLAGWHTIVCWLAHAGHREAYRMPMPLDTSGGKSNAQAMGSTQMYGMRRALCGALNIITIGEDNDGKEVNDVIKLEDAAEIDRKITEVGADKAKFLKFLGTSDVREILAKDYGRAMNALKEKARKK